VSRLKFIADCVPYGGQPDAAREEEIGQFVAAELGIPRQDVEFAEAAIADPAGTMGSVEPTLVVFGDLDPEVGEGQREFVLRIGAVARAVALRIVRIVVQQVATHPGRGAAMGALSGAALGGAVGGQTKGKDALALGLFVGAILGALIGGAIGADLKRDGPVLGIWRRDAYSVWRWTAADEILSTREYPA